LGNEAFEAKQVLVQVQQGDAAAEIPPADAGAARQVADQGSKQPPIQAAKVVGINYSTAKTIIFFNRNHGKSYQFDFLHPPRPADPSPARPAASYRELPLPATPLLIEVISTIGLKNLQFSANESPMCGEYGEEGSPTLPIKNYPLTHANIHDQQKGKTEDVLT
jgi:hypothetical protein